MNRLRLGGMLPCFSHLFISEKIGASKPSEEFFGYCLRKLIERGQPKIFPEEIMIIGDSLSSDMTGGAENGLKTCFFDRYHTGITNGLKIDYIVENLSEIRSFL